MDVARFKKKPVMGILRISRLDAIEPLIDAVISAGLETMEITMNSVRAPDLIRDAKKAAAGRLTLGAGTVLNTESLKMALDSGATFIVTPVLINEVMEYCVKNTIPVFPGALTPSEIYASWNAGATMVKVFPAWVFGAPYFTEIKAPFANIELLACGGVKTENIRAYFSYGASAVSFGASVFKNTWLEKKDFASISEAIRRFVSETISARA
jgi:2-dehydro-3-deoxyphosphogluconate aldolase/(4S)-4-hydroxy-2-oxoglutarate aldolase